MGHFGVYSEYKFYPTKCQYCRRNVFYYENELGSKVFFNELGPPWPKHNCAQYKSDRKAQSSTRQPGAFRLAKGGEIRPMQNMRSQKSTRSMRGSSNSIESENRRPRSYSPKRHDQRTLAEGIIREIIWDADILRKAGISAQSFGASILRDYAIRSLVQLTIQTRNTSAGDASFTFFVDSPKVKKHALKRRDCVRVELRGIVSFVRQPVWVCPSLSKLTNSNS